MHIINYTTRPLHFGKVTVIPGGSGKIPKEFDDHPHLKAMADRGDIKAVNPTDAKKADEELAAKVKAENDAVIAAAKAAAAKKNV